MTVAAVHWFITSWKLERKKVFNINGFISYHFLLFLTQSVITFIIDNDLPPQLPQKKKNKLDEFVYEIKPNKSKGVWEEKIIKRPKGYIPTPEDDKLDCIVNERKAVGWKMELLVVYKGGDVIFSTIQSCYQAFPKETEEYLLKYNWIQVNSKDKWRKLGFRTDPKSKRNRDVHDYDEFSQDPKILDLIKKSYQKVPGGTKK